MTLVPKNPNPSQVKDYGLVSFCTIVYKTITKILSNKIKQVINDIVSLAQSAFIEGRSIIKNTLFSLEVLKWYTRKGLSPKCVIKVDLRKAYYSIEWSFLESVLADLGFS